jgi:hypothetical protein
MVLGVSPPRSSRRATHPSGIASGSWPPTGPGWASGSDLATPCMPRAATRTGCDPLPARAVPKLSPVAGIRSVLESRGRGGVPEWGGPHPCRVPRDRADAATFFQVSRGSCRGRRPGVGSPARRAAAAAVHENGVAIHAVDSGNGLPYLVMPHIAGRSLQQRVDLDPPGIPLDLSRFAIYHEFRGRGRARDEGLACESSPGDGWSNSGAPGRPMANPGWPSVT